MPPPPPKKNKKIKKNSCPEIESGGFWQLADYPTLVFKIKACLIGTGVVVIKLL